MPHNPLNLYTDRLNHRLSLFQRKFSCKDFIPLWTSHHPTRRMYYLIGPSDLLQLHHPHHLGPIKTHIWKAYVAARLSMIGSEKQVGPAVFILAEDDKGTSLYNLTIWHKTNPEGAILTNCSLEM